MRIGCGWILSAASAACLLAAVPVPRVAAQTALDEIAVGRDVLRGERTAVVAEAMQLSGEEGKAFWPLYREYRAAMDGVGDGLVKLVLEYAAVYTNVPEDRAGQMLKDYTALEEKFVATRVAYLKKFAGALTAAKALRFAQVENRLDLVVRRQIAGAIPLVPAQVK